MLDKTSELVFLPLGGVGEIGMNLALYGIGPEFDRSWLMVDCGVSFAGPDLPGIDLVFPDIRYIMEEKHRLSGIVITHAHEDHYGALKELWPHLEAPLYLSAFAHGLLRAKFPNDYDLPDLPHTIVNPGERLTVGKFDLEFVAMSHSIPEPMAVVIRSGTGTVIHTGDWKIDTEPGVGKSMDLERLEEIGNEGVRALVCDSTNSIRDGFSPSESDVAQSLSEIFAKAKNRVAISIFASNVARIRAIALAAKKSGRNVVVVGRAMSRTIDVASELGYLKGLPKFLEADNFGYIPKNKVVALCTGSQGESRAALAQIAEDSHNHVSLEKDDLVIFSSRTIPGKEKEVASVINGLVDQGVQVMTNDDALVHVSGHPRKDELKQLYGILKPDMLVPVHGEPLHLEAQATLATECGINEVERLRNGDIMRLSPGPGEIIDNVPSGILVKDGNLLIEPEISGISERRKLSYSGAATAYITINKKGQMLGDVQVSIFGLPDEDEDGEPFEEIVISGVMDAFNGIPKGNRNDTDLVANACKRGMRKAIYRSWGKKPLCSTRVNLV